jgi:hypothetical protein
MAYAKRKLVASLLRRPVGALDTLNQNAALGQWLRGQNIPQCANREGLYSHINQIISADQPITYLEFGVWRGASMASWTTMNRNPVSRFYGFDSFEGLPHEWKRGYSKGHFGTGGKPPEIPDSRITWMKGWFQQTLPKFLETFRPGSQLIINNDSDLYSSTLYTLTVLDHFLVPGTIIIFDEFYDASNEFRAYKDYTSAYMRKLDPLMMVGDFAHQIAFVAK